MKREELIDFRRKKLIENHNKYDFPEFLSALRQNLSIQRMVVCKEAGIKASRLYFLEHGQISRIPMRSELLTLSDYYDVPTDLLERKCEEFLGGRVLRQLDDSKPRRGRPKGIKNKPKL